MSDRDRADRLEAELGFSTEVSLADETRRVDFIRTMAGQPIDRPAGVGRDDPPAAAARAFLADHAEPIGIKGSGLDLMSVVDDAKGGASVRLQQMREGIPVLGGEVIVSLDARNRVLSMSGEAEPSADVTTEPNISAERAADTAIVATAKSHGVDADDLEVADPELWIYDSRLLGGPGLERPLLVWRTEVTGEGVEPIRELVLVDALRGAIALHFNQIAEAKTRRVCNANNTASQVPCTTPVRTEGGPATGIVDVDKAYEFAGDTYDFLFQQFNRDSLNGAGMPLISTVKYCDPSQPCPFANAFWNGQQMVYGDSYASADDVVGHELAHGYTDFTSSLFYYYQSGAINESISDVLGEFVDLHQNPTGADTAANRWLMGEDLPIGAIRDMENPGAFGDPDKMTSLNYTADVDELDSGGVHSNSGVNNKAAFLMTDGATFNGQTVTGIGIVKVAKIYNRVSTTKLTSGSDYANLADALQQSCTELIGTAGITSANCVEVADAVAATEMRTAPPGFQPAPDAPTCPTGQVPSNAFFDNLENTGSGNWTTQTIFGSNNWYYPQNTHPFTGFDATYATSGDTNIWGNNSGNDPSTNVPGRSDSAIAMTTSVAVPAGTPYMRFAHAFGFEDDNDFGIAFDGGVVEYSTNGGGTWNDAGGLFVNNGYDGTLVNEGTAGGNPLEGRQAFVGESGGYISSRLNLAPLAGQNVRFRFRLGTDEYVGDYGWFIDDIRIYTCVTDSTPPDTTITSGPDNGATISDTTPTFTFTATEAGSTFECSVDGAAFSGCGSPRTTQVLSDGAHTFRVRARDSVGNVDGSPAQRSFTVDTTPPPQPDGDGDGVPDTSDQCPAKPGPASNGGCPVTNPPPGDADGDGVPDASDACPSVAGPESNAGCPLGEPPPDDQACSEARAKLKKAKAKLRKLKQNDASAQKIRKAKKRVRKAKQAVEAAC